MLPRWCCWNWWSRPVAAMRVRAIVAYDGTEYSGFQRQANAPTVQAALEAALAQIGQEGVTVLGAGRTDAGVHALGQVIAFDTSWAHGLEALLRAMNAVLPPDIVVRAIEEAPPDFHPRYDARSRCYRYTVYHAPVRCPLARRYSLHVSGSLDIEAMQRAAQLLPGTRDFASFGQPTEGESTVRTVFQATVQASPPWLTFDIEANAFLYRMVRSIMGTLLQVGQGELSVEDFAAVLESRDRSRAGPTAPPHGLCLMAVKY
ncbi:MAG: tRNA pseudouridine(38-40) synthase TruA [Anaerolineae bacterium]|nr:tRNA pseudouridine(38-40) synthase TruA [Anaerolineae bacterium]